MVSSGRGGVSAARSASPRFSARRAVGLGLLTVAVLVGGVFGWGVFASISGAVIAMGRIEVETRDQPVEHIDGGTVGEILVRDGDRVEAGAVLVRLDDGRLRTEASLLESEAAVLAARRNRLEAEFGDASEVRWDDWLIEGVGQDASVRAILEGERRLFEARRSSREGQAKQLARADRADAQADRGAGSAGGGDRAAARLRCPGVGSAAIAVREGG